MAPALVTLVLAAAGGQAEADERLPVDYSWVAGVRAQQRTPGLPPTGANDPSCRVTARHPNPVVLLHGFASTDTLNWHTMAPLLANAGYCVYTTVYGRATPSGPAALAAVQTSAAQIAAFIDGVLARTGARRVDLVGHSVGGAIPFYYLNYLGGVPKVDHYIALGAPFHGSTLSGADAVLGAALTVPALAAAINRECGQCGQLRPNDPFLAVLHADPRIAPAIHFTDIVTRDDEIATPYTTGLLDGPNVTNIVVQDQCPLDHTDHLELAADPIVGQDVLNALDPAQARAPVCVPVRPLFGP
jgi:pimeloyl-ACP methyl ester carboxylesterase